MKRLQPVPELLDVDHALAEKQGPLELFNHEKNALLGTVAAGDAAPLDRQQGLRYEIKVPEHDPFRRRLIGRDRDGIYRYRW